MLSGNTTAVPGGLREWDASLGEIPVGVESRQAWMPRAKTTASAGSAKRAAPARSPVEMLIVVEGIGGDGRTELTVTGWGNPDRRGLAGE
jgi:hypothetical protein